jgi:Ssp1 endopeptidase immunity protein Rap1a
MSDAPASTTPRPRTALRRAVVGATLLAGLFAAGGAQAVSPDEFRARTARELLDLCSGGDALTFCYGYVTGAGDLHQALVEANSIKPLACGTSDITLDQVREAFRAWAQANPGKLGGSAIDGLAEAAAARWPCPGR